MSSKYQNFVLVVCGFITVFIGQNFVYADDDKSESILEIIDFIATEKSFTNDEYADVFSTLPATSNEDDLLTCLINAMNLVAEKNTTEISTLNNITPMSFSAITPSTVTSMEAVVTIEDTTEPIEYLTSYEDLDFPRIPKTLQDLAESIDIQHCPQDSMEEAPQTQMAMMTMDGEIDTWSYPSCPYYRQGIDDYESDPSIPIFPAYFWTPPVIPGEDLPQITIPADTVINTTTVFSSDNLYILDGPVYVENGASLIIQQGTVIWYDLDASLIIRDQANLITNSYGTQSPADPNKPSKDMPTKPIIFMPKIWYGGISHCPAAIVIDETAGDHCKLTNLYIKGARIGLLVKRQTPIYDNYFYACLRPIVSMGHHTHEIINNQIILGGWDDAYTGKHFAGIEIYTDPEDPNLIEDSCAVLVAHNTIHDCGHGLIVHGHQCPNDEQWFPNSSDPNNPILNPDYHDPNEFAPEVYVLNNIMTMNHSTGTPLSEWPACYFCDGVVKPVIVHTGLTPIGYIANIPVEALGTVSSSVMPFCDVDGEELKDPWDIPSYVKPLSWFEYLHNGSFDPRLMFLTPNTEFRCAGFGEIYDIPELLGYTATIDFVPVSGRLHLGKYYAHSKPNVNQGFAPSDLDKNGWTNLMDFSILSQAQGLCTDPNINPAYDPNLLVYHCDFDDSGMVDVNDVIPFSENWLSYGSWSDDPNYVPEHPAYTVEIDKETDFVHGDINFKVKGYLEKVKALWLRVGSELVCSFEPYEEDPYALYATLDTTQFGNGLHQCQIVSFDDPNGVTVSHPFYLTFANAYHNLLVDDETGIINGITEIIADVNAVNLLDETQAFEYPIMPGGFTIHLSEDLYSDMQNLICLQFLPDEEEPDPNEIILMAINDGDITNPNIVGSDEWIKNISKQIDIPDPNDPSADLSEFLHYKAALIIPFEDPTEDRKSAIKAFLGTMKNKNKPVIVLYEYNAHPENVRKALTLPNVAYVYMITHSNTQYDDETKPFFKLCDGKKRMFRGPRYVPVFACREDAPDGHVHARDWGLVYSNKIKLFVMDSCESAKVNDFAIIFGIWSSDEQAFVGWTDVTWSRFGSKDVGYGVLMESFWRLMRTENLYQVMRQVIEECGSVNIRVIENFVYLMYNKLYADLIVIPN